MLKTCGSICSYPDDASQIKKTGELEHRESSFLSWNPVTKETTLSMVVVPWFIRELHELVPSGAPDEHYETEDLALVIYKISAYDIPNMPSLKEVDEVMMYYSKNGRE